MVTSGQRRIDRPRQKPAAVAVVRAHARAEGEGATTRAARHERPVSSRPVSARPVSARPHSSRANERTNARRDRRESRRRASAHIMFRARDHFAWRGDGEPSLLRVRRVRGATTAIHHDRRVTVVAAAARPRERARGGATPPPPLRRFSRRHHRTARRHAAPRRSRRRRSRRSRPRRPVPWCGMVWHGVSWCVMVSAISAASACVMVCHGVSRSRRESRPRRPVPWCGMVCVSWCVMVCVKAAVSAMSVGRVGLPARRAAHGPLHHRGRMWHGVSWRVMVCHGVSSPPPGADGPTEATSPALHHRGGVSEACRRGVKRCGVEPAAHTTTRRRWPARRAAGGG